MTKNLLISLSLLSTLFLFLSSCGGTTPSVTPSLPLSEFSYDFETDAEGWVSSFLGYSEADKESFNFQSGVEAIPNLNTKGLLLSANNPNAQLVMYVQKQLSGLIVNQDYNLLYQIGLGSNLSSDTTCEGLQGKRTEVKISASLEEPQKTLEENLSILDLGTGPFQRVGVVGHAERSCEDTSYAINKISNITPPFNAPVKIKSDANGNIWAVIVLDSTFLGNSKFYIDSIDITATPPKE